MHLFSLCISGQFYCSFTHFYTLITCSGVQDNMYKYTLNVKFLFTATKYIYICSKIYVILYKT